MPEPEKPAPSVSTEKGMRNALRWEGVVSYSDVVASLALLVSVFVAFQLFYKKEDLSMNVTGYFPFHVNQTAFVTMHTAFANNGTQPAIVSRVSLVIEWNDNGQGILSYIPWREFSIGEANRGPLKDLLYVAPILVTSKSLVAKTFVFQFDLSDRNIGPDEKVEMTLCIEFIDGNGQELKKRDGSFNMYIAEELKTEFDNAPFTRIDLLPNKVAAEQECGRP